MESYPLITCICITRGKPVLLNRAIECFEAQTYPHKELLIIYEQDDLPTKRFLQERDLGGAVRAIEIDCSPKKELGKLRNIAIEQAKGSFICQWDDDDWYHAHRMEYQFNALKGTSHKASLLTQWLVYDSTGGHAYISNKRLWEGSILCSRQVMQEKSYDHIERGEDTAVIEYLKSNDYIHEIDNKAGMYVYIYHGKNTWHIGHWKNIFEHSRQLSPDQSGKIKDVLEGKYSYTEGSYLIDELLKAI